MIRNQKPQPTKSTPSVQPVGPLVVEETIELPSPEKLAQAVEDNMRSLANLLEEELSFLGKRDMQGMLSLRERKAQIFRQYQAHMVVLSQKPTLLKEAPAELRSKLKQSSVVLSAVAKRNATGLKAAISVTQGILETVISAAREDATFHNAYTDPRKKDRTKNAYSPICPPVAVDRTA